MNQRMKQWLRTPTPYVIVGSIALFCLQEARLSRAHAGAYEMAKAARFIGSCDIAEDILRKMPNFATSFDRKLMADCRKTRSEWFVEESSLRFMPDHPAAEEGLPPSRAPS